MRPADQLLARGLADLAAEGGLHDPDAAIDALCRRLNGLPEGERAAALRFLVTGALESLCARLGAASLAAAGRRSAEMLGRREAGG